MRKSPSVVFPRVPAFWRYVISNRISNPSPIIDLFVLHFSKIQAEKWPGNGEVFGGYFARFFVPECRKTCPGGEDRFFNKEYIYASTGNTSSLNCIDIFIEFIQGSIVHGTEYVSVDIQCHVNILMTEPVFQHDCRNS